MAPFFIWNHCHKKHGVSILPIFLLCLANTDGAVTAQGKIMKEKDNIQRLRWCFVAQKHFNAARFYSTHRISGNSLTSTATSIWMDGVSSSKMMSAMWQMTLSNQDELDSWSRDTSLSNIKQLLWILHSSWVVFGLSVWLNLIQTLILPPPRGLPPHVSCFFFW